MPAAVMEGTITKRTDMALTSLFDDLKSMYSREDFQNELCRAFPKARDIYDSIDNLCRILSAANIKYNKNESPEYYLQISDTSRKNAAEKMINVLAPYSEEYVKSVYSSDHLIKAILDNIENIKKTGGELPDKMEKAAKKYNKALFKYSDNELYSSAKKAFAHLDDELTEQGKKEFAKLNMMFKSADIKAERNRTLGYYFELINKAALPSTDENMNKAFNVLFNEYNQYPSPEKFMERIVNRLAAPQNNDINDTLRVRILKQFIINGNYLVKWYQGRARCIEYVKEKTGKSKITDKDVIANIDDSFFTAMSKKMNKEKNDKALALKKEGKATSSDDADDIEEKYELFKVCDDLASGKFKVQYSTKKALYLFAMAFDMTYYSGSNTELYDPETDIEKNLFVDYYTNSFFRFLQNDYQDSTKKAGLDCGFTGEGINYKNYAEMIFIYYLSQDIPAREKIGRSYDMIKAVKGHENDIRSDGNTRFFRARFTSDIIKLPENEFKEFILTEYDCGKKNSTSLEVCNAQTSAFIQYGILLDKLNEVIHDYNIYSWELQKPEADLTEFIEEKNHSAVTKVKCFFKDIKNNIIDLHDSKSSDDTLRAAANELLEKLKKTEQECLYGVKGLHKSNASRRSCGIVSLLKNNSFVLIGKIGYILAEYRNNIFDDNDAQLTDETYEKIDSAVKEYFTRCNEEINDMLSASAKKLKKASANLRIASIKAAKTDFFADTEDTTEKYKTMISDCVEHSLYSSSKAQLSPSKYTNISLDTCNMGLWFIDPSKLKDHRSKNVPPELRQKWTDYLNILEAVNNFIGISISDGRSDIYSEKQINPKEKRIGSLNVSKKSDMNRTYLITAYYYWYILSHETEAGDVSDASYRKGLSFEEIFDEIKSGLDEFLKAAYYPEFSGKNIFDVIIALSAYSYLTQ